MLLQILVMAAAAAPAPEPANTVSPVVVSPSQAKPNIAAQVDVAGD